MFALSKLTNKFKAARVGVKFNPPTLGIEYNTGNGDEKKALKVDISELIQENPDNAGAILTKLTSMHSDVINENVVSMPQVLRLVNVLVEKASVPTALATTTTKPKSAATQPVGGQLVIKVGGTVKAKLGNWKQAYSGEVLGINDDGTFHVKFSDGEVMKYLQKKWIIGGDTAKVETSPSSSTPAPKSSATESTSEQLVIKVGGTIKAKLGNWKQAYSGEVLGINDDGTFHVKFSDGEVMKYLQKKWIIGGDTAKVETTPSSSTTTTASSDQLIIKVGATIKAKLGNWKQAYNGEVLGINTDGTFHVRFEDGEVMKYLQKKWIIGGDTAKVVMPGQETGGDATAQPSSGDDNVLKKGKAIKAKLPNWQKPYNGVVQGVNKDGTVHVKFEDGDEMKYLQKKWIIGGENMILEKIQTAGGGYVAPDGTKFTDRSKYRKYLMKTMFTFEKKTGQKGPNALIKAPGSVNGEPFDILDLDDCEAAMCGWASQVQVDRCKNSKIMVGPVESSIFVRDCTNCEFTIACRQLRTRDCTGCTFHLISCTDPIIERSTDLTFTPYNGCWYGQRKHFEDAKLDPNDNHWRLIFDFNKNGKDNYGVPDPHYKVVEGKPEEWKIELKGECSDFPCENPVPHDAIATSQSEGGSGFGESATQQMMKEMVKEKAKDNKPKVAAKPWAWVKEANRARVEKGMECRVTFSREEGQAVRNSSFYEGVVTGVNDDKTFFVTYADGDEEKDVDIKYMQIRKWD